MRLGECEYRESDFLNAFFEAERTVKGTRLTASFSHQNDPFNWSISANGQITVAGTFAWAKSVLGDDDNVEGLAFRLKRAALLAMQEGKTIRITHQHWDGLSQWNHKNGSAGGIARFR